MFRSTAGTEAGLTRGPRGARDEMRKIGHSKGPAKGGPKNRPQGVRTGLPKKVPRGH